MGSRRRCGTNRTTDDLRLFLNPPVYTLANVQAVKLWLSVFASAEGL